MVGATVRAAAVDLHDHAKCPHVEPETDIERAPNPAARPRAAAAETLSARGLVALARKAALRAYAPYSEFPVGAAVVDERGRVHLGTNVENVSYGLTVCAERVAIFQAVASGARRITAVAVSAPRMRPISPCGACRQVIAEFAAPGTPVHMDAGRRVLTQSVAELLPGAFGAAGLP